MTIRLSYILAAAGLVALLAGATPQQTVALIWHYALILWGVNAP